ncbi:hypothetical protein V6N11_027553 [Hibiscus sabdariffa]|uniref:RNase H type-1 domain-containing protein n=1 Tax=Hibiscus sabdariffa TaxID=183260 RepID=A0ABR2PHN1_9ROSI
MFLYNIGSCSCLQAELWRIYEGLATAWSLRYPRVLIETDSREAFEVIMSSNPRKIGSSVLPSIFELRSRSWEVRFAFDRCEGNAVADAMLRPVCPDSLEYRRWLEVPPAVRDMVLAETNLVAPLKSAVTGCMLFPLQRANDDPGGY